MNKVSIIIGSKSDSSTMEKTKEILDELEIPYEFNVISAHRDLEKLRDYVSNASKENKPITEENIKNHKENPAVTAAALNLGDDNSI